MMNKVFFALVMAAGLLSGCMFCGSPVRPGTATNYSVLNIYSSHMVLQRHKPIQICGKAEPGGVVKVALAGNAVNAAADDSGMWRAELPAMEAGGPYQVVISGAAGVKPLVLDDVLIGEVWLCSGQSNMHMPVRGGKFWCSTNGHEEAAKANYPRIRIFHSKRYVSPGRLRQEIPGVKGWEVCSPRSIGSFSALGYYFGRKLHQDLNVPIGLIDAYWGGTRIESWISKEGFAALGCKPEIESITAAEKAVNETEYRKLLKAQKEQLREWVRNFYQVYAKESAAAEKFALPELDDSAWQQAKLPDYSYLPLGVRWFRFRFDLPEAWRNQELKLVVGRIDDLDETFLNGVKIGYVDQNVPRYWVRRRVYRIPAGRLGESNVLAIRVSNIADAGNIGGPLHLENARGEKFDLSGFWKMKDEFIADVKKTGFRPSTDFQLDSMQFPATLFNGMVNPWKVYPIRGFIWYQGCANYTRPEEYMLFFPRLISDWRNHWGDHSMPFVYAQLAAFGHGRPDKPFTMEYLKSLPPGDLGFSRLREVQTAALNVPGTGMGVAIDIGDHSDIHPANKQDLAYRMAMEAERIAYGSKKVSAGPMFRKMSIEGSQIRVFFDGIGSGLVVRGGELNCFAVAGKDGRFVWAKARLDGDTVVVSADAVKEPAAVRYAWAPYPVDPNLYNKEGFPVCPFRSDMPGYLLKK